MTNAAVHANDEIVRRARLLKALLKAERWTGRQVALAIGSNSTYIQARLSGRVDLSFTDIARIAPLLKMDGAELFTYLANEEAPTPEGEVSKVEATSLSV